MKKISYYLLFIVLFGIGVVSFWIYQKYFKVETQSVIAFQVARGDLRETVSVRGEVLSQKEFELEFPFGGTVQNIFVKEGTKVKSGEPLIKLDTKELDLEHSRLSAVLAQAQASLSKLLSGAVPADLHVSETKVAAAEQSLKDTEKSLADTLTTSYTLTDDAIHNKADQFFDNPRTSSPIFNQTISDSQLQSSLGISRVQVETVLTEWKNLLPSGSSRALVDANKAEQNLNTMKSFLLDLATAINSTAGMGSVSQTTLDGWQTSVLTARTNVDSALTAVVIAEAKTRGAESALALAQSELALKKSAPQTEDVKIAEAKIDETNSALASIKEKILKSTLAAPGAGIVKKILLEEKEIFKPGTTALVFASTAYKIQADVSELDISKVRDTDGNSADVRFDAFPGKVFKGEVVFIEPKEIIKNEDVYFRTNIFVDVTSSTDTEVRSGMSADVVLYGALKKAVLTVPELAIEKKAGKVFVKIAPGATTKAEVDPKMLTEQEVTTGISDGESVEILSGLKEGDVVVVSSE